jgi:hypothetical protein
MQRTKHLLLSLSAFTLLLPVSAIGATVSFSSHTQGCSDLCGGGPTLPYSHADLNNDGREDLVWIDRPVMGAVNAFYVNMSTGDGTYAAPVAYQTPQGSDAFLNTLAIGDFNNDGKADVAVFVEDGTVYLYLNKGNGALALGGSFASGATDPSVLASAADINRDGNTDLLFVNGGELEVWFGNGKGGFTAGPFTPVNGDQAVLGDFDGDGNVDVALGDTANFYTEHVLYGDGTGHFLKTLTITAPTSSSNPNPFTVFSAIDVNSDGRTDLVAAQPGANVKYISVYYGNVARTFANRTTIPLARCAGGAVAAADVDGNGFNDLLPLENDCNSTNVFSATHYVDVLTRNPNSSYNKDQTIFSSPTIDGEIYGIPAPPIVLRGDLNTKPDVAVVQCADNGCFSYTTTTLLNTTSGSFPSCAAPNAFKGVNVCSPASGTAVSSPVAFKVGAAGPITMRDVEVWVDGSKLAEQLDGFSNYTFLDHSLSLSPGSHKVTIFAAGIDQSLQKKSFTLSVK